MKKTKGAIVLLIIAVVVAVLVACSSKSVYTDKEVTLTQVVTDEAGQAVTDANGEVVTEQIDAVVVTNSSGQTVTEVVTKKDGTAVTTPSGEKVTQAVTQKVDETSDKPISDKDDTTKKDKDKPSSTTKKSDSTKPSEKTTNKAPTVDDNTTKPTKPAKPTKPTKPNDTTATTTEPTTLPPTTAVGEDKPDEEDIKLNVVLPLYSQFDANKYTLYITIGDVILEYPIDDGCRGQQIEVTIPKKYKGKKAIFKINLNGKDYIVEGKIKKGERIEFETIVVVTGEDD